MSEATGSGRADRADRKRNRDHLIAVARAAFAEADETNSPVSLNAIARAAGVGIGTLYRHFPTREALAEAVYISKLNELTDDPDSSTAPNGELALRAWFDRYIAFMLSKRGMIDTVRVEWASGTLAHSEALVRVNQVIADLMRRGVTDGTIRPDVRAEDVSLALLGVLMAASYEDADARAARQLDLLMRGISTGVDRDHAADRRRKRSSSRSRAD